MPILKKDLDNLPIYFPKKGEVNVTVGPCSAMAWKESRIALDGRHYHCAGVIIFKNGQRHRASFRVQTHHFDFLERDSVYLHLDDGFYNITEPEILPKLGLTEQDIFPYKWLPHVPLDYSMSGPYPMEWP